MNTQVPIYWPIGRTMAIVIAGGALIWCAVIWHVAHALMVQP